MFFGQVVALTDSGAGQFVKRSNLRRFKISGCALFQKPIGHQVMTRALASRPFGKKANFCLAGLVTLVKVAILDNKN